jgi:hypothetical protein
MPQSNAFEIKYQTASARLPTISTLALGHGRRIFARELSPSADEPKLEARVISDSFRLSLVLDGDQVGSMSPAAGRLSGMPVSWLFPSELSPSRHGPSRKGS